MSESTPSVPAIDNNPKSLLATKSWFYWLQVVVCLILIVGYLYRAALGEGLMYLLPLVTLFIAGVIGPKEAFRRLWQVMGWIYTAIGVINLVLHVRKMQTLHGSWLAWIAIGVTMGLVPILFAWPVNWRDRRISRWFAWVFGTAAGTVLVGWIAIRESNQELERMQHDLTYSQLGINREAFPIPTDGLFLRFFVFALAAFIAYRFDWIQKHLFGAGRKVS